MFTNKDVMELRKKTGAGVADCKKALEQTEGDMEKAMKWYQLAAKEGHHLAIKRLKR